MRTELLPHQRDGVEKLKNIKVGALFMEQGTGKTRTALELFKIRMDKGKVQKAIWLCPCSVKRNLKDDIVLHCDEFKILNNIIICGIETLSASTSANVYLNQIAGTQKCMLIVDESLLVKNPRAYRTRNIIKLSKKCMYRLILNGTPIGKNESDLFAQFYILDWRILGYQSYWSFAANHLELDEKGKIVKCFHIDYLTKKIAPYVYQVGKSECLKLPSKHFGIQEFELSSEQYEHYRECVDVFLSDSVLDDDSTNVWLYRAFTVLQEVASGRKVVLDPKQPIQHTPFFKCAEDNPRIQALLSAVKKTNDKTVVWTKFQHEIDDINSILLYYGYRTSLFHGGIPLKKRLKNLEFFKEEGDILIANKNCAGFGLNLQYCHNAIYYNNDWTYSTKEQSEDRLHRLGQTHDVDITDIFAISTIDERILECLRTKENLADIFKENVKDKQQLKEWIGGMHHDSYWIKDISEN